MITQSKFARRRLARVACAFVVVSLVAAGTSSGAAHAAPAVASVYVGLQQGSQGGDVRALQQALIAAGFPVAGGADGVFGTRTKSAVVAFQTVRGLSATGVVDEATSAALATPGAAPASAATSGYGALAQGSQGDAVKTVQQKLIAAGVYLSAGADGVWGAGMTRGVKQFQGWNGLTQTGSLNDATVKKLGLAGSTGQATPPPAAPPVATPATSYVGLKQGSIGPLVKELQQALMKTGLVIRGGADGVFGSSTAAALKAFQGFNGLSKTGIVTERGVLLLKLGSAAPTPPPPPVAAPSPYLGLKIGAGGRIVVDVQKALIAAGLSIRGGADGSFGNATKTSLISYQAAVGIAQSGVVDQATIDKLGLGLGRGPIPFANSNPTPPATPPATPPSPGSSYVGLKSGASGPLVKELQWALMSTGLVIRGGADGSFGVSTTSALKAFQSVNGLAQSGVVTERDAQLMALGTGKVQPVATPAPTGNVKLDRFPVQGQCYFGDTWGAPRSGGRVHQGVDIIAAAGKLLYAVVDGTISKLYWDQPGALSGNGLRVEQANGTYFTYLHMLDFAPGVTVGTQVKAGDVIGFVGSTGSSATPHLHFEIHPNGGGAVNPYPYVKAIDECSNTTPRYQGTFA